MSALLDELSRSVHDDPAAAPKLTEAYAPAYQAWRAAPTDPKATSGLLGAVGPVLDAAVKPFGGSPLMRSRAKRIVLDALPRYDERKADLPTFLRNELRTLQRVAGQHDMPIGVPERLILQRRDLDDRVRELEDQLGREPSDSEIADATGFSLPRIAALRRWQRPVPASVVEGVEGNAPAVERRLPQQIFEDFVYSDLNPRDQLILDYALGRNGREQLPGGMIAQQLGITPAAVSQRLAAIQQRFDRLQDIQPFGE